MMDFEIFVKSLKANKIKSKLKRTKRRINFNISIENENAPILWSSRTSYDYSPTYTFFTNFFQLFSLLK